MNGKLILTEIVGGVLICKDDKFLLIQEGQGVAKGVWNLPAGRVEKGMTIEETAIKEAKEESGFEVRLLRKLDIFQFDTEMPACHSFAAEIVGGREEIDGDEIMGIGWFTLDEIRKLDEEGKTRSKWVIESAELLLQTR